jgi:hypothetical protein
MMCVLLALLYCDGTWADEGAPRSPLRRLREPFPNKMRLGDPWVTPLKGRNLTYIVSVTNGIIR